MTNTELSGGDAVLRIAVLEQQVAALEAEKAGRQQAVPVETLRAWCDKLHTLAFQECFDICGEMEGMLAAATPAPAERVELPGMWHDSDLEGGETDCPAAPDPSTAPAAPDVAALPFVRKILDKLARVEECFSDACDADVGLEWLRTLEGFGLLTRIQRSPSRWTISPEGEQALATFHREG